MLPSVRPVKQYLSSLAGNPLTRQAVCVFNHHSRILSRNRDLISRSGIFVFKLSWSIEE